MAKSSEGWTQWLPERVDGALKKLSWCLDVLSSSSRMALKIWMAGVMPKPVTNGYTECIMTYNGIHDWRNAKPRQTVDWQHESFPLWVDQESHFYHSLLCLSNDKSETASQTPNSSGSSDVATHIFVGILNNNVEERSTTIIFRLRVHFTISTRKAKLGSHSRREAWMHTAHLTNYNLKMLS